VKGFIIIYGIVAVISAAFVVLPPHRYAPLWGASQPSRLWIRLFGGFGLLWLLLALATNQDLKLVDLSAKTMTWLHTAKSCIAGIMIGLLIAILTRRFEQGGLTRNFKGLSEHPKERNAKENFLPEPKKIE
jgi:hypothetical protein